MAKPRLAFLVNEVAGGWSPKSTRLGGTEESVVEWAKQFKFRGYEVKVFHNGEHGNYDGVEYLDREKYRGGDGITINLKSPEVDPREPTFYFTNETDIRGKDLTRYSGVIWPSKWAMDNIPVKAKKIRIVPHGYDPKKIYPETKVPKTVLYASSPDRGLDNLLEVWPEVYAEHPDANLILTYGTPANGEGIMTMGEVNEDTMNSLIRNSDIWCHPASGGELYCMVGVKAQVAQCVPVYFPIMALQETVRYGIATNKQYLAVALKGILGDEKRKEYIRNRLAMQEYPTWEISANILETVIKENYGRQTRF